MNSPNTKTVKRLFAVSGNTCAFPNCESPLVDQGSNKVTGRICHIKGHSPGSKRHDPSQTAEQRHDFDNLMLLCPTHHHVIDNDEIAYTIDRLLLMKRDHEKRCAGNTRQSLTSDALAALQATANDNVVSGGSVIISQNQLGGQVAHSIVNIGPQPRSLTAAALNSIAASMRQQPPERYEIERDSSAPDAAILADQLVQVLDGANWTCIANANSQFPRPMLGLQISYPSYRSGIESLVDGLRRCGIVAKQTQLPTLSHLHILVGHQER